MQDLVKKLSELLRAKHMKIACAKSCTGGLLAAAITHRSGASDVFECGFVTYSNASKTKHLNVAKSLIANHGAVSAEVAEAMAEGVLAVSDSHLAISITGIAGPNGGSDEKPVGTVYFGFALKGGSAGSTKHKFEGLREQIQAKATSSALKQLITVLESQ